RRPVVVGGGEPAGAPPDRPPPRGPRKRAPEPLLLGHVRADDQAGAGAAGVVAHQAPAALDHALLAGPRTLPQLAGPLAARQHRRPSRLARGRRAAEEQLAGGAPQGLLARPAVEALGAPVPEHDPVVQPLPPHAL